MNTKALRRLKLRFCNREPSKPQMDIKAGNIVDGDSFGTLENWSVRLMPGFRLTPDAQTDLIEIRRFTIRQWSKAQSQNIYQNFSKRFDCWLKHLSSKSRPDVGLNVLSFPAQVMSFTTLCMSNNWLYSAYCINAWCHLTTLLCERRFNM